MQFAITITGAPHSTQAPQTAYSFALALYEAGHAIERLFLYGDGVLLASNLQVVAGDEPNWGLLWRKLVQDHNIQATVCVASALRRGMVDEREAQRHELGQCANVPSPWVIAGLGDWIEMTQAADRHVLFGPSY